MVLKRCSLRHPIPLMQSCKGSPCICICSTLLSYTVDTLTSASHRDCRWTHSFTQLPLTSRASVMLPIHTCITPIRIACIKHQRVSNLFTGCSVETVIWTRNLIISVFRQICIIQIIILFTTTSSSTSSGRSCWLTYKQLSQQIKIWTLMLIRYM